MFSRRSGWAVYPSWGRKKIQEPFLRKNRETETIEGNSREGTEKGASQGDLACTRTEKGTNEDIAHARTCSNVQVGEEGTDVLQREDQLAGMKSEEKSRDENSASFLTVFRRRI